LDIIFSPTSQKSHYLKCTFVYEVAKSENYTAA
jgi:hypothetical protein